MRLAIGRFLFAVAFAVLWPFVGPWVKRQAGGYSDRESV